MSRFLENFPLEKVGGIFWGFSGFLDPSILRFHDLHHGWWLNQPIWKNVSQIGSFPQGSG